MFCTYCGKESEKRWHKECHAKAPRFFASMKYCEKCGEPIEWPSDGNGGVKYRTPKCLKCHPPDIPKMNFKAASRSIAIQHPSFIKVIYECACKNVAKLNHHFDYTKPFDVIRLCNSCHVIEHSRLRLLAAQAAENTHLTDVPVSLEGDNLTRTSQHGNGDNAPDTVLSVAQVEPERDCGKTATETPSRLAEMR